MYGVIKEHGAAPYNFDDSESPSYFITIEQGNGKLKTIWSLGLDQALSSSKEPICLGDRVEIIFTGKEPVRLPSGKWAHRSAFEIKKSDTFTPKTDNAKSTASINKATGNSSHHARKSNTELRPIDKFTFALVGSFFGFIFLGAMFA